jgi:hypothetical protein
MINNTVNSTSEEKPRWKHILGGVPRVLLGLITGIFALIHFNHNEPLGGVPEAHMAFEQAMINAGYFFPTLGVIGAIAATLLLIGRGRALALVLLAPLVINYVLFKVFLDPSTLIVPVIYAILFAGVAYVERNTLGSIFTFQKASQS